jgi:hypothetical protein
MRPTGKGAPQCGSFVTDGANLPLGPYEGYSLDKDPDDFACNWKTGKWFSKSYYAPSFMYSFTLTQQCEYTYSDPSDPFSDGNDREVRDVNSWFDAAAKKMKRPGHVGYKVSDDTIGFTGWDAPNHERDLYKTQNAGDDSVWCPEDYCVKVSGNAVGFVPNNYDVNDDSGGKKKRRNKQRNRNLVFSDDDIVWDIVGDDYHNVEGRAAIQSIGNDITSVGLREILDQNMQTLVTTYDGAWWGNMYLPPANDVPLGTKIKFVCGSTWQYSVFFNDGSEKMLRMGTTPADSEVLLIALDDTFEPGRKLWFTESKYVSNEDRYALNAAAESTYGNEHLANHNSDFVQYGCTGYGPDIGWHTGTYESRQRLSIYQQK